MLVKVALVNEETQDIIYREMPEEDITIRNPIKICDNTVVGTTDEVPTEGCPNNAVTRYAANTILGADNEYDIDPGLEFPCMSTEFDKADHPLPIVETAMEDEPLNVRVSLMMCKEAAYKPQVSKTKVVATVGQLLINETLPDDLKDYKRELSKRGLKGLLHQVALKHPDKYVDIGTRIKALGDQESLYSMNQLRYKDFESPLSNKPYVESAKKDYKKLLVKYKGDKDKALIGAFAPNKDRYVQDLLIKGLQEGNGFATLATSGARGKPVQMADTIGGSLLVSDYNNKPIPIIIDKSYSQGLTGAQHFAAAYGTRRGLIAEQMSTPLAGHMSKMLSWTMGPVVVVEDDCHTNNGVSYPVKDDDNIGKYLAKSAGKYPKGTKLTADILDDLLKDKIEKVVVRSPTSCESENGICAKCLGTIETGRLAAVGYNAGLNATSAMVEPITQAMLSEKHTGGSLKKDVGGFPLLKRLTEIPGKFPGSATLAKAHGKVDKIEKMSWGGWTVDIGKEKHYTAHTEPPIVKEGDLVEKGDVLTTGIINPAERTHLNGIGPGRKQLAVDFRKLFSELGSNINRNHFEVAARSFINFGKVTGDEKVGVNFPGDIANITSLTKDFKFNNAVRHKVQRGMFDKGWYLAKPALHYSIGTELTAKVQTELADNGYNEVWKTRERPPITPLMVRVQDTAAANADWVARLGSQGIKKALVDATHRNSGSETSGASYIHPYVYGVTFGDSKFY